MEHNNTRLKDKHADKNVNEKINPWIHRLMNFNEKRDEQFKQVGEHLTEHAKQRRSTNATRKKNAKYIARGINSAVSGTKHFMIDKPLGFVKDTGNMIRNANNNSKFSLTGQKKYKLKNLSVKSVNVSANASLDKNGYVVIALKDSEKKTLNDTFEKINDFGAATSGGSGPTRKRRAGRNNAASHLKKSRRRRSRFL
jgi:hypothetical protein